MTDTERHIARHAMRICLKHGVDCKCKGCEDIYRRLWCPLPAPAEQPT